MDKETAWKLLGGIGWIAIFWFIIVAMQVGKITDDAATVNVFPDNTKAKNYELTGTVTRINEAPGLFFLKTSYSVDEFNWPNGGYANFASCIAPDLNEVVQCTTKSGDTYWVKVTRYTVPVSSD